MKPVLVDNNVLSSLAKVERLAWLNRLFTQVGTTPSVLGELHDDEVAGYGFVARIDAVKTYNGGWLDVVPPSEDEVELAEDIVDASLSFADAECIAVALGRDRRLLTDDGHVGELAGQRGVEVWDLKLFLEACVQEEILTTESELEDLITDLQERDHYRFAREDRADVRDRL